MGADTESFNNELYNLLKVRGYKPVPLNSQNQRVSASQEADVIEFTFVKDGEDYGKVWISIDNANSIKIYFDDTQQDSPTTTTPGKEYDDTWTGLLKFIKVWAQRRQLSFELTNKDRLGDDMRQRDYFKMKEKLGEGYYPMGKKASYNDAVPNVKIVLQHNRSLEEGEQRYRNIAKIYLENVDGERFLAPTTKPGVARVYARHIAEGGLPNDDRWNHIKSICEDYNKMAGFVRATRNGQFNESALELVNEGINHYQNLRETLHKMTGHRGYQTYFESWTPSLMEDALDESINELFVQENIDPRIESAMPILSRLKKPTVEMAEVSSLAEWADDIINEKLELDEVLDTRDAKMSYAKKNMDSHQNAVSTYHKSSDPDEKKAADKTAMKRLRGMNTFVNNKVSTDDLDESRRGSIKHADWFDIRKMSDEHGDKLDDMTMGPDGPGQYLEYGDNYGLPEYVVGIHSGLKNADRTYAHLMRYAKPFKADISEDVEGLKAASKEYDAHLKLLQRAVDAHFKRQPQDVQTRLNAHLDAGLSYPEAVDKVKKDLRNKIKPLNDDDHDDDVSEDLDANQKRAGQLGPTGGPAKVGDLVGANESTEFADELTRIIDIARFNR